jgi:uncharacterized membrane protein
MPVDVETTTRDGLLSLVAALFGLAVSIYLTVEHYTAATTLACPNTGAINCAKVTSSSWSRIGPVPMALLGSIFFLAMAVLCSPPAWRRRELDTLRVAGAVTGVGSALYLVWVELFQVDAICLWCTAVHLTSLVLLGAVLWTTSAIRDR